MASEPSLGWFEAEPLHSRGRKCQCGHFQAIGFRCINPHAGCSDTHEYLCKKCKDEHMVLWRLDSLVNR